MFAGDVTADEFASALDAAGFDVDSRRVRSSVTDATRSTVVDGLRRQLDDVNEYSGAVRTDGGHVVVELSDTGPEAARRFVTRSRSVELVAEVTDDGSETATTTIFTGEEIREIGNVQSRQGAFTVPLTFTDSGAERFETEIDQLGFTAESGIQNCGRTGSGGTPSSSYCLLWMVGDEVVTAHGMARGLANAIADGSWGENPRITVGSSSESGARERRHVLLTGDLPTTLDLDAPATDVSRFDA